MFQFVRNEFEFAWRQTERCTNSPSASKAKSAPASKAKSGFEALASVSDDDSEYESDSDSDTYEVSGPSCRSLEEIDSQSDESEP